MAGTGILEEAIIYKKSKQSMATHFVLCNGKEARYFISIHEGKKHLTSNLSTYSKKLTLLMRIIRFLPFIIMEKINLGYFIEARINNNIQNFIDRSFGNDVLWNVIIGTYDEKQKIVIQCWKKGENNNLYYKIGNKFSSKEMINEIEFLKYSPEYLTFNIPKILDFTTMSEDQGFNIMLTEEFKGQKVEPILNKDIYFIYKELSKTTTIMNGIEYEFSQGDFAPWNIKLNESIYTLFDWEHCGMRIKGFDIMHFAMSIEIMINGNSIEQAFDISLEKIKKIDSTFSINKNLYLDEFKKLRLKIGG